MNFLATPLYFRALHACSSAAPRASPATGTPNAAPADAQHHACDRAFSGPNAWCRRHLPPTP